jgi:starch phosphorylase
LISSWNSTQNYQTGQDEKRVYYLSLEFLIGRSLDNAVLNLDLKGPYKGKHTLSFFQDNRLKLVDAMRQLGFQMEDLIEQEVDAGLGNGGLGKCFE